MKVVRWRSGKVHISEDGLTTICGSAIRPDRARVVQETTEWPEQVNCYNCAYRHTPPGYLSPSSGQDFPLKRECPSHPDRGLAAGSCYLCDPSTLRPQNWPCPNGCNDPADHSPLHRYTRCTVFPPRREAGPNGRCFDGCESKERAMRRANPRLWFDLADSAMTICYHCGEPVCVRCQRVAVDIDLEICDQCGDIIEENRRPAVGLEPVDLDPDSDPCDGDPSDAAAPDSDTSGQAMLDSPSSKITWEPSPRRAKEKWSETEHSLLIELLRDGLPLDDLAVQLGRGVEAVASRCQKLLPPGERVPRADADLVLRHYLASEPDYDWHAGLRAEAARRGSFYWHAAADTVLRDGWGQDRPLADLVAETDASELEVAARLVELGLAANTIEVASRLGCEPGATLDVRVRMATDRAASAVWVLVADGLRGSERAKPLDHEDTPTAYRHVSLHARAEDARQAFDRLLAGHLDRGGHIDEVSVTVAERTVGDLAVGGTHHGRGAMASW